MNSTVTPEQLSQNIIDRCTEHGLDPALPEIVSLLERIGKQSEISEPKARMIIGSLDPTRGVIELGGSGKLIAERFPLLTLITLTPLTLARHAVADFDERLTRIVVDEHGTHTYDQAGNPMASFAAAALRRSDDNVVYLLNTLTGLPESRLTGLIKTNTRSLTFVRDQSNNWEHPAIIM